MGNATRPQAGAGREGAVQERRRVSGPAAPCTHSTCTVQASPGPRRQGPGRSLGPRPGQTKEGKMVTPPTLGGELPGGRPRDGQFSEAMLLGKRRRASRPGQTLVTSLLVPPAWGWAPGRRSGGCEAGHHREPRPVLSLALWPPGPAWHLPHAPRAAAPRGALRPPGPQHPAPWYLW